MRMWTVRREACSNQRPKNAKQVEDLLIRSLENEDDLNISIVSGSIVRELTDDQAADGEMLKVVLISFATPTPGIRYGVSDIAPVCEVEIPSRVADPHRTNLREGQRIVAFGELTVMGGLRASRILTAGSRPGP